MTAVPRDLVVFGEPGTYTYVFPEWARWMIVTARGADGGNGTGGPGEPGQQTTGVFPVDVPHVVVKVGMGGRHADGSGRGQDASITIELFEEDPR